MALFCFLKRGFLGLFTAPRSEKCRCSSRVVSGLIPANRYQVLYVESRFRTMPENRQIFSNWLWDIDILPETGSATTTIPSETSRTATQWSDRNVSFTITNVMPASLSSASERK